MREHSRNAQIVAEWLEEQPGVAAVHFPGLASYPQKVLAERQQSAPGGIVAFEVEGGREAAWQVIDRTRVLSITANLGDVRSTITHPATTTHGRLTPEERARAGIGEGLIRLAVGLESVDDLIADLARGLSVDRV
jgi:O-succinylhomoserine sulfhydrylase